MSAGPAQLVATIERWHAGLRPDVAGPRQLARLCDALVAVLTDLAVAYGVAMPVGLLRRHVYRQVRSALRSGIPARRRPGLAVCKVNTFAKVDRADYRDFAARAAEVASRLDEWARELACDALSARWR